MNNIKRIIVLLITLTLSLSTVIPAFAQATSDEVVCEPGDTVTLTFDYENISGILGTLKLSDDSVAKIVDVTISESKMGFEYNAGNNMFYWFGETDSRTITVVVKVSDSAVDGDECVVTIDYTVSVENGDKVEKHSDVSVIKIEVEEVDELDYTALQKAVDDAQGYLPNKDAYTTDSWSDFEAALEVAEELLAAKDAETQKDIDDVTNALLAAIAALELIGEEPFIGDYTALEKAVEEAQGYLPHKDAYTADSWSDFEAALEVAEDLLAARDAETQKDIDDITNALLAAIAALEPIGEEPFIGDYTELEKAVEDAQGYIPNKDAYTTDSWAKFEAALEAAKELLNARDAETQAEIDAVTKALLDAIADLEPIGEEPFIGDYTELEKAVDDANAILGDEDKYTATSWSDFITALEAAKELLDARDAETQDEIDEVTKALVDAQAALVLNPIVKELDYSALENLFEKIAELNEMDYTADSWSNLQDVLAIAKAFYDARSDEDEQPEIDAQASALQNAYDDLVKLDFDALDNWIAIAEAILKDEDSSLYTEESWNKLVAELSEAKEVRNTARTQEAIDTAAAELEAATNLELKGEEPPVPLDYTELDKQIAAAEALVPDKDLYTEETWKALETTLEIAKRVREEATTQAAINEAAKLLEDAITALVKLDYTELNEQIDIAEDLVENDYTEDSWAVLETALEAAKAALSSKVQEDIDAAAKALEDAINGLKKPDYTALNEQIAIAEKLNKDDYTEESWAVLEDALKTAIEARNSRKQNVIDSATDALEIAINGLVEKTEPGDATNMIVFVILAVMAIAVAVVTFKKRKSNV